MAQIGGTWAFWIVKRAMDIGLSLALVPLLLCCGMVVALLNPWLNPGPLVYRQARVGRHGAVFVIVKLRSMVPATRRARFADAEGDRIGRFGQLLRRYRVDELPQIINVLRGEMSLIGPRPEQPDFAQHYHETLPGYAQRHLIRPGISGLAQVTQGYTSDADGTRRKLALDLHYIRRCGFRLEGYVLWRTVVTVITGHGAK